MQLIKYTKSNKAVKAYLDIFYNTYDKNRIDEYEKDISKSAYFSYLYATNIKHGRFTLGETKINKTKLIRKQYLEYINRDPIILI